MRSVVILAVDSLAQMFVARIFRMNSSDAANLRLCTASELNEWLKGSTMAP